MPTHYQNIVVLTGAGISAESGIKTFRDNDGLWENHRIEEVATPEAFHRNPKLVQRFYNLRRAQLVSDQVQSNLAHQALADFEKAFPGKFTLVTQNVDNLHESAGSNNILHMHGELLKVQCTRCQHVEHWEIDIEDTTECPKCGSTKTLRPHIVWFGEMPLHMNAIEHYLSQCDLFISIGTSGNVYPAAGFVEVARSYDAHTVELNLEPSNGHNLFEEHIHGKATEVVPSFLKRLLAE